MIALVDPERAFERLGRLHRLLLGLEDSRAIGQDAYLADEDLRAQTERRLQLAIQICIDLGAQLLSELGGRAPRDYADVFAALAEDGGPLDSALAGRLANAARLRNLLVHEYLAIDDAQVFAALGRMEDLRAFASVVGKAAGPGRRE